MLPEEPSRAEAARGCAVRLPERTSRPPGKKNAAAGSTWREKRIGPPLQASRGTAVRSAGSRAKIESRPSVFRV